MCTHPGLQKKSWDNREREGGMREQGTFGETKNGKKEDRRFGLLGDAVTEDTLRVYVKGGNATTFPS